MYEVQRTRQFSDWLQSLRDGKAIATIAARLFRLEHGHPGDSKPVGSGVLELRIDLGPGYRVYYTRIGSRLLMVLGGGDKGSQSADIAKAIQIATELKLPAKKKGVRRPK